MNKTVLITGTSSGLGRTTARHFTQKNWNVIATSRRPLEDAELNLLRNVLVTRLDVQDQASIAEAVETGLKTFGRIDAVINNAGFGLFGIFEGTSREKIQEQFDVNLFGVMDVIRAVLPHFRANKDGVIINVGSGAGVFTLPMISLYCASKFALEGFTESLAYELLSQGIKVKMIEPGGVISTRFGKRSEAEAAHNSPTPDYEAFVVSTLSRFAELRGQRLATEEHVAEVIFGAATDGTDQLRYVATDDIHPLVKMRRETSEAEYLAFMRARFLS